MNVEHEGDRALKPRSRGDAVDDREKPSGSMRAIRASRDVCKMRSRIGDVKAGSLSRGKADGARFTVGQSWGSSSFGTQNVLPILPALLPTMCATKTLNYGCPVQSHGWAVRPYKQFWPALCS